MQNDDAIEQTPDAQSCEQQSPFCEQALPDVLHALPSAWHVPFVQVPLQQSAPAEHARPSEAQTCPAQRPPAHDSEQQSSDVAHDAPGASQFTGEPARQVSERGSQRPEQQARSLAQGSAAAAHEAVPPTLASKLSDPEPPPPHPPQTTAAVITATNAARANLCIGTGGSKHGARRTRPDRGAIPRRGLVARLTARSGERPAMPTPRGSGARSVADRTGRDAEDVVVLRAADLARRRALARAEVALPAT